MQVIWSQKYLGSRQSPCCLGLVSAKQTVMSPPIVACQIQKCRRKSLPLSRMQPPTVSHLGHRIHSLSTAVAARLLRCCIIDQHLFFLMSVTCQAVRREEVMSSLPTKKKTKKQNTHSLSCGFRMYFFERLVKTENQ